MEMPQGPVRDLLVHAVVRGRRGDDRGVDELDGEEVVGVVDGAVVEQLVDQLGGRLVPVLVRQRKAEVVEEEDHLESLWRTKDSSTVLVQVGHH